jgi:putative ABC transport system permease protein
VWLTDNSEDAKERGARRDMVVIGRLGPGLRLAQARAEMEGIAARLEKEYPRSNDQFSVALQPIRDAFVGHIGPAILVLFGAVLFVLLIACANAIGKRFMFGHPSAKNPPKWCTIVGVVSDTKLYGLANPARLEVYVPLRQNAANTMYLVVRSGADPAALTSAIREAVQSIDKDQPLFAISTMKELVRNSVVTRRMTLVPLGLFSGLALILGAIGIYGVISYSVAQRTHEIGIRIALGAPRSEVFRLVVGKGLKLAGIGIAIGVVVAFELARLMSSLLYAVSATDFETFAGVAILLALVALLACYVPARRAMRVDPMVALKYE